MYGQFSASHFRRFEEVELRGLNRVNLITGPNGVGKTSLLEGLFICSGAFSPELAIRINAFRGMEGLLVELGGSSATIMRSLFHDLDAGHKAVLRVEEDDGTKVEIAITIPQPRNVPSRSANLSTSAADTQLTGEVKALQMRTRIGNAKAVVSTLTISEKGLDVGKKRPVRRSAIFLQVRTESTSRELAARLGKVTVARQADRVVDALKIIEPRLVSITSVLEGDQTVVYADIGKDELVPLWLLGGGINHLAHIVLAMMEDRGRVVLIDEVENGVYYGVLPDMWRVIGRAARETDCQVFATTHSRECVAAAHQVFSESLDYDLSVHRLESSNGRVEAISYDKETLEASIEAGFEVR
jgi:predicted ATPase